MTELTGSLEEPQIIDLFTHCMLLHTQLLKDGSHIDYNTDDMTYQKWSLTK